jgi:hypothetical protein
MCIRAQAGIYGLHWIVNNTMFHKEHEHNKASKTIWEGTATVSNDVHLEREGKILTPALLDG